MRRSYRMWRHTPVVSATIIATLALAIGANTTAFSIVRAVLLDPLPYPDAGRLAILWTEDPAHSVHTEGVSYPNYADWRSMNHSFRDLAFFFRTDYSQVNLTGTETAERVQSALVSSNFFDVLGTRPARGRSFDENDLRARSSLVILGAGLAARRFGSKDPLGQTIGLDGRNALVVGVMPPGFHFPNANTEIWEPYTRFLPYRPDKRDADYLCVLGRLKPGVSMEDARADMRSVGQRLERAYPNMPRNFSGFGVNVVPLYEQIYGRATRPALLLIAAVALCVLLIAITNITNLLLARLEAREREFAIRAALGARRGVLARQLLTEAGYLSGLGGILGVAIALGSLAFLRPAFAERLPRLEHASLDWMMVGACVILTFLACLAAALTPMLRLGRDQFAPALRKRNATGLKRALAASQITLATALLGFAGLLLRSYSLVERVPLGYNAQHLLIFELVTRPLHARTEKEDSAYSVRVASLCRERIASLPGVLGVANAGDLFLRRNPDWEIFPEGRDTKPDGAPLADDIVSAGFFRVMGIPLIAGRVFTPEEERDPKRLAVIVNEALAHKYWPGIDPIGKRLSFAPPAAADRAWRTVIGVVGNMQVSSPESGAMAQFYTAIADYPDLKFIVRTTSDPNALIPAIRREVQSVDAGAVVYRATTIVSEIDRRMGPRRMNTSVVGVFSILATLLAGIGVFSLLHYATAMRTREFGIRFAVGATPLRILHMVVGDALMLAAGGAVAGTAAAGVAAHAFSTLLFGVRPWDSEVLISSLASALLVTLLAALTPALRAAMLNPADVLRAD